MGKRGLAGGSSGFVGRMEIRESATGRRDWPDVVKGRIVRESFEPGARVKDVAQRHGMAPQQLTTWRREARRGRLALPDDPTEEDAFGFAALVVADPPRPELAAPKEAAEVTTPAAPVEIVAALGARR